MLGLRPGLHSERARLLREIDRQADEIQRLREVTRDLETRVARMRAYVDTIKLLIKDTE